MRPAQLSNLRRLLAPRHAAFIGGRSAELAAGQCLAGGFPGKIWGVNPSRREMTGCPCFASIADLPEAPDAVFLAVPAAGAVETVAQLRDLGAGGIVSYTAGFGELGADGQRRERDLVRAAGDMALVGPNCSGLLNFVQRAALWPFDHGGQPVSRGPAFITQSGMLGNTVTMNQRSLSFSYVISAGNQAMLGVEDFLEILVDDPAVSAIGLYIEGLKDVPRFAAAALRCLEAGKPIVAQKVGTSEIGGQLTVTHTGSLSGSDRLYKALFARLGVIGVDSTVAMMECLKIATVAGIPKGTRVAALTCSGGDSTMVADAGEKGGITFPQASPAVAAELADLLPPIATLSNPLDYTTPLWGNEAALRKVFPAFFSDGFDAALMVQDYPTLVGGESYAPYQADARAFAAATQAADLPAAVVSVLPENLDEGVRETLIQSGVAPLQGMEEGVAALAAVARFGALRQNRRAGEGQSAVGLAPMPSLPSTGVTLDEWAGKQRLAQAGVPVPQGRLVTAAEAPQAAADLGFPVVLKLVSRDLPHKSEAGAVKVNLTSVEAVAQAVAQIKASVAAYDPKLAAEHFLVERMVSKPLAELLIGYRLDPLFGSTLLIGAGGVMTELLDDVRLLLWPVDRPSLHEALRSLKVSRLFEGYRGAAAVDLESVVAPIAALVRYIDENRDSIRELDINPLMVCADGVWAADVLMAVSE